MSKKLVLLILMISILALSVSAISKYYSPIVTGQDISGELSDGSVYENLILGTPDATSHRATFNTCQFAGSGDGDYRYMNVDDDGIIYLTDDDFINIFDNDCNLIASHSIVGILGSQPYIFDIEGDGFKNIFYIGTDIITLSSDLVTFELVNGILINDNNTKFIDARRCVGLYCDRNPPFTSGKCATMCGSGSACDVVILDNLVLMGDEDIETSLIDVTSLTKCQFNSYDEASNKGKTASPSVDYFDRTIYSMYGMDIDVNDNIDFVGWGQDIATQFDIGIVDLTDESLVISNVITSGITAGVDTWYSSGGLIQTANYGTLNSNGEIFFAGVGFPDTSSVSGMMIAEVYNSELTVIKRIIKHQSTGQSRKISNFAVADIDRDLKNDYCLSFNDTARDNKTKIHCYSGLTNSIMTNCTINEWATNNPIHLSLLEWDTISPRLNAITTFGIFDLSTNDGTSCSNLRPTGFTGLTSASEGALVPVIVSGVESDTIPDLIYYGADGARLYKTDDIVGETGDPTGQEFCGFDHVLLCDDFDYTFPFVNRNWRLYIGQNFNSTATPIENRLFFTTQKRVSIEHTIPSTDVIIYKIDERETIARSDKHPVVSHEFDLNLTSNQTVLQYRVFDTTFNPSIDVKFESNSTFFWNETLADYQRICINCLTPRNASNEIKITQFFGQDTFDEYPPGFFPFNSTTTNSHYEVWVNDVMIGDNLPFKNVRSFNPKEIFLIKESGFDETRGYKLDDLFIYRGDSREIDTSEIFILQIFTNASIACLNEGNFCETTTECCGALTCFENECRSSASELVTDKDDNAIINAFRDIPTGGLSFSIIWFIVMLAAAIGIFLAGQELKWEGKGTLGIMLIFEILLLIVGTLLGFIPAGIIITLVVMGLAIVGLFLRKILTGSTN